MNPVQIDSETKCLVFKTNVADELQAARLSFVLEKTPGIKCWNLDLEDKDHVLRISFHQISINRLRINLFRFKIRIEELPIW